MSAVLFVLVLISHAFAARTFWRPLRAGEFPSTAAFAVVSVILFYDVGITLEMAGYPYQSPYFGSLLDADQLTVAEAMGIICIAPWLFLVGAALSKQGNASVSRNVDLLKLRSSTKGLFLVIALGIGLVLAAYSLSRLAQGQALWVVRADVGALFGPAVLVFYFPLYFVAFFTWQRDSRGRRGAVITLVLTILACLAPLALGERTLLLMPPIIALVFRFRISTARLVGMAATAVLFAALLLPVFKWQYASSDARPDQLIAATVNDDLARAAVLRKALEVSSPVGTEIMPYPMAGYVYTALFFVPRGLAPYKGVATAQYFTGSIVGTPPEQTDWGFGIGAVEEVMTNLGTLALVPGLLIYGVFMGWLDRLSRRFNVLIPPIRLAALFLCGYNLSSLLLLFGGMAFAALLLHQIFVQRVQSSEGASATISV